MSLLKSELKKLIGLANIPAYSWQLPDTVYETVSELWVGENWTWWLESRAPELVQWGERAGKRVRIGPIWFPNSRDCENLAFGTTAHGMEGNAISAVKTGKPLGGLAYGFMIYIAGPARPENFNASGGHSINWFVDHDLKLRFFEPGVGKFVELNSAERNSAWFGFAA